MNLLKCIMTNSTCYKGTTKGKPVGILWHDTGAGNPELRRYVQPSSNDPNRAELLDKIGVNVSGNSWNQKYVEAGVNAFIGKLANGSVATVQVLPWDYRPWGCGSGKHGSCNGSAALYNSPFWIQFEICDDFYRSKDYFKKVYKEAVELTAYLCKLYNIDPKGTVQYNGVTVPTILCHQDSYKLGLGSNHGDVLDWFDKMGGYTMKGVRNDVADLLKPAEKPVEKPGVEEMTKEEITKLVEEIVDKKITDSMGKMITDISEIPWESVRKEMRKILDAEAIDGGTPYEQNPDDIRMPLNIIRALVGAERFTVSAIKDAFAEAFADAFEKAFKKVTEQVVDDGK